MKSYPFRSRCTRCLCPGIVFACALFILASAYAGEIEVFSTAPPKNSNSGSGFDARAAVRIEPTEGNALALNLLNLPEHQFLKIEAEIEIQNSPGMDLSAFMMLDGRKGLDPATMPRSRLQIGIDGKSPAVDASFGGMMAVGGSFPDREGDFLHPPGTGSEHGPVEIDADDPEGAMGLMGGWDLNQKKMSTYRISFAVPHSLSNAAVEFTWKFPEPVLAGGAEIFALGGMMGGAPFSIKKLTASVLDEPVSVDVAGFSRRFQDLGSPEPVDAMKAFNDLVVAGHSILPMLRDELGKKADPDLEKKFAEALSAMDDPSFQKRAAAAKALSDLGQNVIPLARRTLAEKSAKLSVEAKNTLENLADRMEHGSAANAETIRINRLHRLLDTIGSDEAKALEATLPPAKIVVAPEISTLMKSVLQMIGGAEFGIGVDPFAPIPDVGVPEIAPDAEFVPFEPVPEP